MARVSLVYSQPQNSACSLDARAVRRLCGCFVRDIREDDDDDGDDDDKGPCLEIAHRTVSEFLRSLLIERGLDLRLLSGKSFSSGCFSTATVNYDKLVHSDDFGLFVRRLLHQRMRNDRRPEAHLVRFLNARAGYWVPQLFVAGPNADAAALRIILDILFVVGHGVMILALGLREICDFEIIFDEGKRISREQAEILCRVIQVDGNSSRLKSSLEFPTDLTAFRFLLSAFRQDDDQRVLPFICAFHNHPETCRTSCVIGQSAHLSKSRSVWYECALVSVALRDVGGLEILLQRYPETTTSIKTRRADLIRLLFDLSSPFSFSGSFSGPVENHRAVFYDSLSKRREYVRSKKDYGTSMGAMFTRASQDGGPYTLREDWEGLSVPSAVERSSDSEWAEIGELLAKYDIPV